MSRYKRFGGHACMRGSGIVRPTPMTTCSKWKAVNVVKCDKLLVTNRRNVPGILLTSMGCLPEQM